MAVGVMFIVVNWAWFGMTSVGLSVLDHLTAMGWEPCSIYTVYD